MQEHDILFRTTINYTEKSISQTIECSYHKPIEANESRLVHTVGSASRKLEILDKNRIETTYYKKSRYLPIDFAQSCDSIVKLFEDKTTRDLLLRLNHCNYYLKYMTYVVDIMSNNMSVAPFLSDLSDGKSHILMSYNETIFRSSIPIDIFPVARDILVADSIIVDVDLRKLSKRRLRSKDYEKYSEILVNFCDTFVNNLPKAKRIALMD